MFQQAPAIQNHNTIINIKDAFSVVKAETPADFAAAKHLIIAYQQFLGENLRFQNFDAELLQIPIMYASPEGALLLAKHNENYIGCVAIRKKRDGICEMKRLYVKETYKQQGIGRLLVEKIIAEAMAAGYQKMILDTLQRLTPALILYHSLGFKETTAYYANPLEGVIYMELDLGN